MRSELEVHEVRIRSLWGQN